MEGRAGLEPLGLDPDKSGLLRILPSGLPLYDISLGSAGEETSQLRRRRLGRIAEKFFLSRDLEHRQEQKKNDPVARNADTWEAAGAAKRAWVQEMEKLKEVFAMLNSGPTLSVKPAIRERSAADKGKIILQALAKRHFFLKSMYLAQRPLAREIRQSCAEHREFRRVIASLRPWWKIYRVPYAEHVFHESDFDFPYRAEFLVEILHVPKLPWKLPASNPTAFWHASSDSPYGIYTAEVFAVGKAHRGDETPTGGAELEMIVRLPGTYLLERNAHIAVQLFLTTDSIDEDGCPAGGRPRGRAVPAVYFPEDMTHEASRCLHEKLQRCQWLLLDRAIFATASGQLPRLSESRGVSPPWHKLDDVFHARALSWDNAHASFLIERMHTDNRSPRKFLAIVLSFGAGGTGSDGRECGHRLTPDAEIFSTALLRQMFISRCQLFASFVPHHSADQFVTRWEEPFRRLGEGFLEDWLTMVAGRFLLPGVPDERPAPPSAGEGEQRTAKRSRETAAP